MIFTSFLIFLRQPHFLIYWLYKFLIWTRIEMYVKIKNKKFYIVKERLMKKYSEKYN